MHYRHIAFNSTLAYPTKPKDGVEIVESIDPVCAQFSIGDRNFLIAASCHQGWYYGLNEDCVMIQSVSEALTGPQRHSSPLLRLVVCDGVGGRRDGAKAARQCADVLINTPSYVDDPEPLRCALIDSFGKSSVIGATTALVGDIFNSSESNIMFRVRQIGDSNFFVWDQSGKLKKSSPKGPFPVCIQATTDVLSQLDQIVQNPDLNESYKKLKQLKDDVLNAWQSVRRHLPNSQDLCSRQYPLKMDRLLKIFEGNDPNQRSKIIDAGKAVSSCVKAMHVETAHLVFATVRKNGTSKFDEQSVVLEPGDQILMMSDGVSDNFSPQELGRIIMSAGGPSEVVTQINQIIEKRTAYYQCLLADNQIKTSASFKKLTPDQVDKLKSEIEAFHHEFGDNGQFFIPDTGVKSDNISMILIAYDLPRSG